MKKRLYISIDAELLAEAGVTRSQLIETALRKEVGTYSLADLLAQCTPENRHKEFD